MVKNPRAAWKYWEVEKAPEASVVVSYDDADDPKARHPAVLERTVGKGKVVLLTTRMDVPPPVVDGSAANTALGAVSDIDVAVTKLMPLCTGTAVQPANQPRITASWSASA